PGRPNRVRRHRLGHVRPRRPRWHHRLPPPARGGGGASESRSSRDSRLAVEPVPTRAPTSGSGVPEQMGCGSHLGPSRRGPPVPTSGVPHERGDRRDAGGPTPRSTPRQRTRRCRRRCSPPPAHCSRDLVARRPRRRPAAAGNGSAADVRLLQRRGEVTGGGRADRRGRAVRDRRLPAEAILRLRGVSGLDDRSQRGEAARRSLLAARPPADAEIPQGAALVGVSPVATRIALVDEKGGWPMDVRTWLYLLRAAAQREEGQTMGEYGVVLAVITLGVILALGAL